jgi:SPP1 family predicted phage head-tail adaptor
MANIASGRMRHKVTFEQDTGSTRNAVGEQVASWSETKKAWCEIRTLNGQELVHARQKTETATFLATTHFIPGITSSMRMRWHPTHGSTSVLHIEDVENVDSSNHTLRILAREET